VLWERFRAVHSCVLRVSIRFFLFFFSYNKTLSSLSSLSSLSLFPLSLSIVLIKQCTFCIIVSLFCRSILLLLLLILALLFFLGLLVMYFSRRRTKAIAPRSGVVLNRQVSAIVWTSFPPLQGTVQSVTFD